MDKLFIEAVNQLGQKEIEGPEDNPEPGDVVVMWREKVDSWKGHVGILFGFSKDSKRVFVLGGNQGNQVSIAAFPSDTREYLLQIINK